MTTEAQALLRRYDALAEEKKQAIRNRPDRVRIAGNTYYVASSGDDANDGRTPEKAWRTLEKVSSAQLCPGDGVLFCRGDVFRGSVTAKPGVTYAAYGTGEKPRFYGWCENLADPALWECTDPACGIWRYVRPILDVGVLVFDEGEKHTRKLIPSYIGGRFVCREDESIPFDMAQQMTQELDLYWEFGGSYTTVPTRGQDFPIPDVFGAYGRLYLRCTAGNPGAVFGSIEAAPRACMFAVGSCENVHIDNLCIKYVGIHAVSAGGECVRGLRVTGCEIGWIGGSIQHFYGTDPNYPQGGRGTVTRFGNGVEIYGGCRDYTVAECYIYQAYDAGITHQFSTRGTPCRMENVCYRDNLVEDCVYSIEYFLEIADGGTQHGMDGIEMTGNFLRRSGYGWGQQRHNKDTPAHIKGWSYANPAANYRICGNIFDRAAYRMLHLVCEKPESLPQLQGNTYIQYADGLLGQYGANETAEPPVLPFDEAAAQRIAQTFGDADAQVHRL